MDSLNVFDENFAGNANEYEAYETEDISPKSSSEDISPKPLPSDAVSSDGPDPQTIREEADAWDVVFGLGSSLQDPRDDEGCFHCECVETFLQEIDAGHFTTRKPSNRKAKKIASMDLALDGQDIMVATSIKLEKKKVSSKPPYGKTWLKQIFAGQMGLTILATFYGMSFGVPRDVRWMVGMQQPPQAPSNFTRT